MKMLLLRRKTVVAGLCLLAAALMLWAALNPAVAGAAAVSRQLPIYSVQREYKVVSLSFDAAWAGVTVRALGRRGFKNNGAPAAPPRRPEAEGRDIFRP